MEAHDRARRMVEARAGVGASIPEVMLDLLANANALYRVYSSMVADLDHSGELEVEGNPGRQRGYKIRTRVPAEIADDGRELTPGYVKLELDPLMIQGRDVVHIHPFVEQQKFWWDRARQIAKDCATLGIAERQVKLAEQTADRLLEGLKAAYDELQIPPADRERANRAVVRKLMVGVAA